MTDQKNAVTEEDAVLPSAEYRLSYVFRLYPTKAQQTTLAQTLETCRLVYNSLLNWRRHDYQVLGKHLFKAEQQAAFHKCRKFRFGWQYFPHDRLGWKSPLMNNVR